MSTREVLDHDDSTHGDGSGHGHKTNPEQDQAARLMLADRETRAVNTLRYVVYLLISVTTILVAGGLYMFMKKDEKEDFENQFSGYAGRIVSNIDVELERKLAALDALAVSYTSHSLSSGSSFPNVTLPHSEIRGANTRILGDTLFCQYFVLVTDETRAGWEAYAAENEQWMDEAFYSELDQKARQDARFNLTAPPPPPPPAERRRELADQRALQLTGYKPRIYGFGDGLPLRPAGSGPFLAYWQASPVMPVKSLLNFDALVHPLIQGNLRKVMETKQAVMAMASNLLLKIEGEQVDQSRQILDFFIANGQYRHQIEKYEGSPLTDIIYPVFDSFAEDRELTGVIGTNVRSCLCTLSFEKSHNWYVTIFAVVLEGVLCRRSTRKCRSRRCRCQQYMQPIFQLLGRRRTHHISRTHGRS